MASCLNVDILSFVALFANAWTSRCVAVDFLIFIAIIITRQYMAVGKKRPRKQLSEEVGIEAR
jgi:hypothetical protein